MSYRILKQACLAPISLLSQNHVSSPRCTPPNFGKFLLTILAMPPLTHAFQTMRHGRAYATSPPPPNPTVKKEPDNTLMYVALGLAAAGGAYFYFKNPEDVQDLKAKAKQEAEQVKQKGRETVDDVKTRGEETLRRGEVEYDQVKVCCFSSAQHHDVIIL